MPGLIDDASGSQDPLEKLLKEAHDTWQASMTRRLEELRQSLRGGMPEILADRCGATWDGGQMRLLYWLQDVTISWPGLEALQADGQPCSTFDTAMLLYYLRTADGTPLADRWISYRELPGGAFYNRAFQGYSGDVLAKAFAHDPQLVHRAAAQLKGWRLTALGEYAYAFQPLPYIRLAAVFWPGDEEFPTKASILFDASSPHYMTTDGLALLGSGLTGRLRKILPSLTAVAS